MTTVNPEQTTTLVWVIAVLVDLAIRIAAIIIIPRNRKPSAAMAWLLAIFLIPYVGILFFLLVGSSKLPKKRRAKQKTINALISEGTAGMDLVSDRAAWPPGSNQWSNSTPAWGRSRSWAATPPHSSASIGSRVRR